MPPPTQEEGREGGRKEGEGGREEGEGGREDGEGGREGGRRNTNSHVTPDPASLLEGK